MQDRWSYVFSELLFEDKVDGQYQKYESQQVVPPESLGFKKDQSENRKYSQRDHLLNHLELEKRKRTAVASESDAVGRNLKHIFEQSNTPTQQNNSEQGQIIEPPLPLQPQLPIPCKSHKNVGYDQQTDSQIGFHNGIQRFFGVQNYNIF